MNIPPKYEDVVAECAALKEELVHMTALRDTWYEQYQELKSSRQQRLTVSEQRAGEVSPMVAKKPESPWFMRRDAALKPAEEGEGS